MTVEGGPKVVTDGLKAYWDANNSKSHSDGTEWIDLVSGIVLTNSGATLNSNGYFTFGGDGDNLESFENGVSIPLSTEVTFAAWWRRTGDGIGSPRIIETTIDGAIQSANSNGLFVDLDGSLRAWLDENGTTSDRFFTLDDATTWTDTDWHYMVMTYNSPTAILYMDSNVVASASVATTGIDDINNIIVGSIGSVSQTPSSHAFEGDIALCQIWNVGLSENEVIQNYNALKKRFL